MSGILATKSRLIIMC